MTFQQRCYSLDREKPLVVCNGNDAKDRTCETYIVRIFTDPNRYFIVELVQRSQRISTIPGSGRQERFEQSTSRARGFLCVFDQCAPPDEQAIGLFC